MRNGTMLTRLEVLSSQESVTYALNHADIIAVDQNFPPDTLSKLKTQSDCAWMLALEEPGSNDESARQSPVTRLEVISRLGHLFDFIELDARRELRSEFLELVPPAKRVCSLVLTHDEDLEKATRRLSDTQAYCCRAIATSGLQALDFLSHVDSDHVTAYSRCQDDKWSRIVALLIGQPIVFSESPDQGPLSLASLIRQFGLPDIPDPRVYGITGYPVDRSVSPTIQNKALRQLNVPGIYLPFPTHSLDSLLQICERLTTLDIQPVGFTVASPLKEIAAKKFSPLHQSVTRAQSANVLLCANRSTGAINEVATTDYAGLLKIVNDADFQVRNRPVAVLGCGGSGRVAADLMTELGADVVMYNRSSWRAEVAHSLLKLPCNSLSQLDLSRFDVVINTIPFGRNSNHLPFNTDRLRDNAVLIDYTYGSNANPLAQLFESRGLKVIAGLVMLANQISMQFNLLTGLEMPMPCIEELRTCCVAQENDARDTEASAPPDKVVNL